jgi:hypothetical protein
VVVGEVFKALVEGFLGVDMSKDLSMKDVLKSIVEGIKNSKGDIKDFAAGLRVIAGALVGLVKIFAVFQGGGEVEGASDKLGTFGKVAKFALGPLYLLLRVVGEAAKIFGVFEGFDMLSVFTGVAGFFAGIPGAIAGFVTSMFTSGGSLIDGLIAGIRSRIGGVVTAASDAASAAVGAVKGFLGIKSPSRVMAKEVGAPMMQGVAVGIEKSWMLPAMAMRSAANDTIPAAQTPMAFGGATQRGSASNNFTGATVQVSVGAGASPETVQAGRDAAAELAAEEDARMARHYARMASAA